MSIESFITVHRRKTASVALGVAFAFAASLVVVRAEAKDKVIVVTTGGVVLVGEPVDVVVGDHLTIRLPSGELKVIGWVDVKSQAIVSDTTTAPPPPVASDGDGQPSESSESTSSSSTTGTIMSWDPAAPLAPPYGGPNGVDVTILSDGLWGPHVKLYGSDRDSEHGFEALCAPPCRLRVDPHRYYRIGGFDVATSPTFRIDGDGPRQVLEVHPAGPNNAAAGWITLGIGVALFAGGVYLYQKAPASTDTSASSEGDRALDHILGVTVCAVSLPLLITGIALLASGGTEVYGRRGERLASVDVPIGDGIHASPSGFTF